MEEQLSRLYLKDGQNALQYVQSLNQNVRQIAIEAILECSKLGYPLNNMEITSKARDLMRKKSVHYWSYTPNYHQTETPGQRGARLLLSATKIIYPTLLFPSFADFLTQPQGLFATTYRPKDRSFSQKE